MGHFRTWYVGVVWGDSETEYSSLHVCVGKLKGNSLQRDSLLGKFSM